MITILTGTPGSGKTSWLISHLISECKKGRKIYTDNVPELVLNCQKAGRIDKWQEGNWLGIDTYAPLDLDDPDFDPDSCWDDNGNGKPDAGALIVVDEAQRWFRPRNSSKAVPPHVAALEVHRHQGLDFLFITQRTRLLDSNVLGLASKHIHIKVTPFGRKIYEWAEIGNPDSREQRSLAAVSKYKPDPKVFDLYKSASLHTKLKHKLPNVVWMLGFAVVLAVFMIYKAGSGLFGMSGQSIQEVEASVLVGSVADELTRHEDAQPLPSQPPEILLSGCSAFVKKGKFICSCLDVNQFEVDDLETCVSFLDLEIDQVTEMVNAPVSEFHFPDTTERFWAFKEREYKRLHPYRTFSEMRVYLGGTYQAYIDRNGRDRDRFY